MAHDAPSKALPATEKTSLAWDRPSGKSLHSLPLGNGEIGINAWVEPPGDLVFYISRTDSWSEQGRLLKLGRVRLRLPNASFDEINFREALHLASATFEVRSGREGEQVRARIWVDANRPAIRIEVQSDRPTHLQAWVELWRIERRQLTEPELHFGLEGGPDPYFEGADVFHSNENSRIIWYHRNESSIFPGTMDLQGLTELRSQLTDPLLHRTFGCAVEGAGLQSHGQDSLKSIEPKKEWDLAVHPFTLLAPELSAWVEGLERQIAENNAAAPAIARQAHEDWWKKFWDRSWIRLDGGAEAQSVGEGYRLQRYYLACAGRGNYPIKFNGSLFTVDHPPLNPDYRRWGGAYWFQNTRLAYWPLLAGGDAEFFAPLFRMFASQLTLARYRSQKYFRHDGAYFGETQTFWGTYQNLEFGWDGKAGVTGEIASPFLRWHLNGNLELLALMLAYFDYTGDSAFGKNELIPMAEQLLRFFDLHYARDDKGQIRLEPGQALETYWSAINNTPDVAGLRDNLDRLLKLPAEILEGAPVSEWKRLRGEIPPIPVAEVNGETRLSPGGEFSKLSNVENPELYAIFPFKAFGVGQPHLDWAQNAYRARLHQSHLGWSQDEIHAAYVGLAQEAKAGLIERFSSRGMDRLDNKMLEELPRFPGAWGPNYDWLPDMDHGGVGMIALQAMLLQVHGDELHLLPAWPADWNVDFKLWAPGPCCVTGSVREGKLQNFQVEPVSESLKIVVHEPVL